MSDRSADEPERDEDEADERELERAPEPRGRETSAREAEGDPGDAAFEQAKKPLFLAIAGTVVGLAIAGSLDRTTGGALVLGAWAIGIFALHRLGRAGSSRGRER